ncbi:CRISPR-associated protein Cas10/Csm1, subtype III-A/MTUBE [Archaeoglobus fulgidus DSM 8774]|uniref:CRISPR system single-strand-specific deoxyribonuclease Cas10/Csm1 (subtype III-A) n=1 Tax=Archaeoglobus fulgidus DSM 8774 TaxID=1344584 RepID=A0A075WIL0_ARCFL|nr:type III-A CRISPR-associated protein Cas10/Csm1 [Archaeoglobus fulgidus]AIG97428.1 CRISPR-associated protein Cas10/Csm1, subtype III-A/MTUBE [Archaeoglobus fulgidus DSM 8774]
MNIEAKLVALAGLLHDIGKFAQRAEWSKEKGTHEEFGYGFLRKYIEAKSHLPEIYKKLPLFARYHHQDELRNYGGDVKTKNLLHIVCQADNLSAAERKDAKDQKFGVENPLVSILSSVDLGKGDTKLMFYPLRAFTPNEFFYPLDNVSTSSTEYKQLFKEFEMEFEKVVERGFDFNYLQHLLEKYTTFIPAMISENNDVSLYDHLRTTSAIALCMYYYHMGEIEQDITGKIYDRKGKKFLLVGGDISGIQDFIYTITSKGALKYLRARSAFLELLVEDVVEEIIERLELTRANVIYAGGGRFYILAPNTGKAKAEIENVRQHVNRWLFDRFWGRLYFAIDYIELSGDELKEFKVNGDVLWSAINKKLKVKKLRKFIDDVPEAKFIENYLSGDECDICKASGIVLEENDGIKSCRACREFLEMGKELPKISGFVRVKGSGPDGSYYEMPFSKFYGYKKLDGFPKGSKVFVKNGYKVYDGFTSILYYVCDYASSDENGKIKDFDSFAKAAIGPQKLAVLRMDVDDLGKIFSVGLPEKEGTFSRIATLSRLLNHFFKNCLKLLVEGRLSDNLPDEIPRLSLRDHKNTKKEVVVVYSGGDDLFIVGAWDHVFELAFEINALFRKYVGGNPNITISAGYAIFDPKYPLYRMAEVTGKREEMAKEEGEKVCEIRGIEIKKKGRICLAERMTKEEKERTGFKTSYTWEEFERIWNTYVTKIYDIRDTKDEKSTLKVPRAVIRKILDARSEYVRNPDGFRWSYLLLYYLSRARYNGKERLVDILGDLAKRDVEKIRRGEPQDIFLIDVPLKLVDFAIRG